ncbi:MAG: aspartate kinase [Bacteroidia bacterium]
MRVYKFGGASVKDADAVKNVATILMQFGGNELLIVVSAMGKTTNALELLANAYFENSAEKYAIYKQVKDFHNDIINGLLNTNTGHAYDDIENLFIELECLLEDEPEDSFDQVYDQIVSYGEIFSTRIISTYLNEVGIKNRWMDCRNFIATDNTYRNAVIDWELTSKKIAHKLQPIVKKQMVVTQGFIGMNRDNYTTTLGREGSDYSAAIFAFGLNAEGVTIWKDVDGVMNADPKFFKDAVKINKLSYPKAIEMAYYGATVIHPKTIQPLQNKGIPLYVKSFKNPQSEGTVVGIDNGTEGQFPVYIFKQNQVLISISSKDFSFIVEHHLSEIFSVFAECKININLMQNSAISFSVCADYNDEKLLKLNKALSNKFIISENAGVKLLTISNYNSSIIKELTSDYKILLEQRTNNYVQFALI